MDIDAHRALRLFQAVVAQALVDATADDKTYSTKPLNTARWKQQKKETAEDFAQRIRRRNDETLKRRKTAANKDRTEARAWLLEDMESFPSITSLAGYNPTDIRERARKLAKAGWPCRVNPEDYAEEAA